MRLSISFLALALTAGVSSTADLGSPLPMPVVTTTSNSTRQAERLPVEERSKLCPCGDNCSCKAGQCPACPTQLNAIPASEIRRGEQPTTSAVATYRQVWIRGMGWVWMQDKPNSLSSTCSTGTCTLNIRSR
jgi:hypothetical protein